MSGIGKSPFDKPLELPIGWTTFGVAPCVGVIPAGNHLKIEPFPTKVDVQSTHPDGSVAGAIVTVNLQPGRE